MYNIAILSFILLYNQYNIDYSLFGLKCRACINITQVGFIINLDYFIFAAAIC